MNTFLTGARHLSRKTFVRMVMNHYNPSCLYFYTKENKTCQGTLQGVHEELAPVLQVRDVHRRQTGDPPPAPTLQRHRPGGLPPIPRPPRRRWPPRSTRRAGTTTFCFSACAQRSQLRPSRSSTSQAQRTHQTRQAEAAVGHRRQCNMPSNWQLQRNGGNMHLEVRRYGKARSLCTSRITTRAREKIS
jgi:hypothetical protein